MLSKLSEIVDSIAEENELKVEGYNMDKIKSTERHLDHDGDIEKAMGEVKHVLGYTWNKYYREIEKQLERRK
jgi:hypothetical protein